MVLQDTGFLHRIFARLWRTALRVMPALSYSMGRPWPVLQGHSACMSISGNQTPAKVLEVYRERTNATTSENKTKQRGALSIQRLEGGRGGGRYLRGYIVAMSEGVYAFSIESPRKTSEVGRASDDWRYRTNIPKGK